LASPEIIGGSMKKVLVVLTILVLVAGLAFADVAIKGKFVGTYKFDFENETQNYNPKKGESTFKLTLAADTKELTGDSGVYAKAAVSIDLSYNSAGYASGERTTKLKWAGYPAVDDFDTALTVCLSLDTVEIVGENWSLDLIHTLSGVDYAKDGFDSKFAGAFADFMTSDKKYYYASYGYSQKLAYDENTVRGVTFNYDGIKVSAAYNNRRALPADLYSLLFAVETKEFDFNGFKLQAFAGYSEGNELGIDTTKNLAASVKAGYETEDVTASVAADVGRVSGDETVYFDVAANVQVKPVVFDFYFAKDVTLSFVDKYDEWHYVGSIENFMSIKAVVALADVIENVPVTVTATAKDVLNDADLSVSVNTTAVENFDITVYFKDFLKKGSNKQKLGADVEYTGIENVTLSAGASYSFGGKVFDASVGAEYAHEMFTASVAAAIEKEADDDALYGVDVKVSSDKLVANAKLEAEFAWDVDWLVKDLWNLGKYFQISCTIEW
jgi:hypothetical protein